MNTFILVTTLSFLDNDLSCQEKLSHSSELAGMIFFVSFTQQPGRFSLVTLENVSFGRSPTLLKMSTTQKLEIDNLVRLRTWEYGLFVTRLGNAERWETQPPRTPFIVDEGSVLLVIAFSVSASSELSSGKTCTVFLDPKTLKTMKILDEDFVRFDIIVSKTESNP